MKSVLITGASRGIGAETARRFSAAGWAVAVNNHTSRREAEALVFDLRERGGTALAVQADVSDERQAAGMIDKVLDEFCHLDALVCNAGVSAQGLLGDLTAAEWRRLFAVNVDGAFFCIRAALPHLIRKKAGRIVTVSSVWGLTGASCEAAYSASKAAVIGLTKALAKELGPSGITVNCVAPGVIETDMNRCYPPSAMEQLREETPLGALGSPSDVAETIYFLSSESGRFYTGQVFSPNGGLII
jgi:3-oxoacyl-[acyl-carrier protein] reductase